MDHDLVVRQKMTERYLLDELDAREKDEFEEHFFDCPECALDVRAASVFVEQSKTVLAEKSEKANAPVHTPPQAGWFAWLRPAFALPAFALLLVVIGYQNLVTYPRLKEAVNRPQVLPWRSINIATRGANAPVIAVAQGGSFLLFVNIPPDNRYSRYIADLYDPTGTLQWSLTIPATAAQDQYPVQVPGANRAPGNYSLAVRGVTAAGDSTQVGRASFELQVQK